MKFACIYPMQEKKKGGWLTETFRLWRRPFVLDETTLWDAAGYLVSIPEVSDSRRDKQMEKLAEALHKREVGVLLPRGEGPLPPGFPVAEGKGIFALFVMEAAKLALAAADIPLQEAKFVVLDGGNGLTRYLLEAIYPQVNHLSVYTAKVESFSEITDRIFADCGLSLQAFAHYKNELMREADVIVNGALELANFDYYFKKGAIYLDVNRNLAKERRLRRRREDMYFVGELLFSAGDTILTNRELSAAAYVQEETYREFLRRDYAAEVGRQAKEALLAREVKVLGKH